MADGSTANAVIAHSCLNNVCKKICFVLPSPCDSLRQTLTVLSAEPVKDRTRSQLKLKLLFIYILPVYGVLT